MARRLYFTSARNFFTFRRPVLRAAAQDQSTERQRGGLVHTPDVTLSDLHEAATLCQQAQAAADEVIVTEGVENHVDAIRALRNKDFRCCSRLTQAVKI